MTTALPGQPIGRRIAVVQPVSASPAVFSPEDLSPDLWLRADSIVVADGAAVTTWADLSGNGRDAAQEAGQPDATRPVLAAAAVNGHKAVRFDGVDDMLWTPTWGLVQPYSLCVVAKMRNAYSANEFVTDGFAPYTAILLRSSSTQMDYYAGTDLVGAGATPQSWGYYTATANGASSSLRANGSQIAAGDIGAGNVNGFVLGGGAAHVSFAAVDVAEVFAKAGVLSGTDRGNLESYFAARYGI